MCRQIWGKNCESLLSFTSPTPKVEATCRDANSVSKRPTTKSSPTPRFLSSSHQTTSIPTFCYGKFLSLPFFPELSVCVAKPSTRAWILFLKIPRWGFKFGLSPNPPGAENAHSRFEPQLETGPLRQVLSQRFLSAAVPAPELLRFLRTYLRNIL